MLRDWLRRIVLAAGAVMLAGGLVAAASTPAHADAYTSYLVTQLRHNPVYISAYADDAAPSDAARVAQILARVPLKAYVVDSVSAGPDGDLEANDLAAVLHEHVGGGQLYILDGGGGAGSGTDGVSATGFGTSLPVADAMQAAGFELNGSPSLVQLLQRFVSILMSGKTEQILAQSERETRGSLTPSVPAWEVAAAWIGGTVIGGGLFLLPVLRRRRRLRPGFRPGTLRLRSVAGVTGLIGVAMAAHPAAHAARTTGPPSSASDGIGVAASSLSPADPLYIDPDMAWMFTPAQVKKITTALRKSPVATYVIAVPFNIDEDDDPDYQSYFLDQLHARTHRNGAYLIIGPSGDISDAEYQVPRDISLPIDTETGPDTMTTPAKIAASTPARVISLITDIGTSPPDPRAASTPIPEYSPGEFPSGVPTPGMGPVLTAPGPSYAPVIGGGIAGLVVVGPLLALIGLGGVRAGRRGRAALLGWGDSYGDPGTPAGRMPASPGYEWLLRHARAELAELGRLIAEGGDDGPGYARACDDYDAGMLIVGGGEGDAPATSTGTGTGQIDLVGAIVLARDGRMALRHGTGEPPSPCLVNPLHGSAAVRFPADVTYRTPVLRETYRTAQGREFPLCQRCAKLASTASAQRLRDRVLLVEFGGRWHRYDEFGSLWREHGFGADGPGLPRMVREHLNVT
ncbi:MAG: hypothetical protein J2P25_12515 [Nocardiopsaceae bacterium]|nr:hypothetical protein [Nocardiopsaceae bacterium]